MDFMATMDSIVPILHRFHECYLVPWYSILFMDFSLFFNSWLRHGFHRSNTPSFPWDGSPWIPWKI
jgi:hypothetical protein